MKQDKLIKLIKIHIADNCDCEFTANCVDLILKLINQHVGEVIGGDVPKLHLYDSLGEIINYTKAAQRKRAGI